MARRPYGADRDASIYIVLMRDIDARRTDTAAVTIVADDLTGAADTASGFAVAGFSTMVTWPGRAADVADGEADVAAIDAGSRVLDAAGAARVTHQVVLEAREKGVGILYKKCDSLMRGHIGVEVAAALSAWHEEAVAIAVFAFPDAGRTTVNGRQRVAGRDGDLPIVPVFADSGLRVQVIDLQLLRRDDAVARLWRSRNTGTRVFLFDAVQNDDLDAVVAAAVAMSGPIVWVGTGGLARAIARSSLVRVRRRSSDDVPSVAGPRSIMIVCGSAATVATEQVARLVSAGTIAIEIPKAALVSDVERELRARALHAIEDALSRERDLVITLPHSADENDHRVADALGELLIPFASRVGGVVATGGDTATALLRAWGVSALRLVAEVEPGVAVSISRGARPIGVVTKAGAFGTPDALVKARDTLHKMLGVAA